MCIISSSFLFLTPILPLQIAVVVARQPVQKGETVVPQRCPLLRNHKGGKHQNSSFHGALWYLCVEGTWQEPIAFPGRNLKGSLESQQIWVGLRFFGAEIQDVAVFSFSPVRDDQIWWPPSRWGGFLRFFLLCRVVHNSFR